MTKLICIMCPKGCHLTVDEDHPDRVIGNDCPRGEAYAKDEVTHPTRVITSTVAISGSFLKRCPVKTSAPIPKALIFEAMKTLDTVRLTAPVSVGQVVVKDVCKTGVDVIATRDM